MCVYMYIITYVQGICIAKCTRALHEELAAHACNHVTSACGRPTVPPDLRCSPSVCDRCLRPVSSSAAWLIDTNQRLLVPPPSPPPTPSPNDSNMARAIFLTNSPPPHHLLPVHHCDTLPPRPRRQPLHPPPLTYTHMTWVKWCPV